MFVCPGKASNSVNRVTRLHVNKPKSLKQKQNLVLNVQRYLVPRLFPPRIRIEERAWERGCVQRISLFSTDCPFGKISAP